MKTKIKIPKSYEVQPLKPGEAAKDKATCGACGLSWDDGICTGITPVPSGRCPFEAFHEDEESGSFAARGLKDMAKGMAKYSDQGHTPTPWSVPTGECVWSDPAKHYVVIPSPQNKNGIADAAFIVKAVNAYAANQETIKEYENRAVGYHSQWKIMQDGNKSLLDVARMVEEIAARYHIDNVEFRQAMNALLVRARKAITISEVTQIKEQVKP